VAGSRHMATTKKQAIVAIPELEKKKIIKKPQKRNTYVGFS
jgi:hypothetical protein